MASEFISWENLRPMIYQLMSGKKLPSYFKIVLSTNEEKTKSLSTEASTFFLNIIYKDNVITCSTACAYATFTMDKTGEQLWDNKMQKFLLSYDFI